MSASRYVCVALPLLLTSASIAALLYATLAGVAHYNTFMFKLDATNLALDKEGLQQIAKGVGVDINSIGNDFGVDVDGILNKVPGSTRITAQQLGLDYVFDVNLWGYCYTKGGKRECSKAQFDWASHVLNETYLKTIGEKAGVDIPIPKEIHEPLNLFRTAIKFTEIAFVAALVLLTLELLLGVVAMLTHSVFCVTWLVVALSTIIVLVAVALATGISVAVVSAVGALPKNLDVKASLYTSFMAAIWSAAALTLIAKFLWILTVCCRSQSGGARRARHRDSFGDMEKPVPERGYTPLGAENHALNDFHQQYPVQNDIFVSPQAQSTRYTVDYGRSDQAYEPYSHRN